MFPFVLFPETTLDASRAKTAHEEKGAGKRIRNWIAGNGSKIRF